ncbi:MAG: hypothetical protein ACTSXN_06245, partial [Promethearchaeota archaeon]
MVNNSRISINSEDLEPNFWTIIEVLRCPTLSDNKKQQLSWLFDSLLNDQQVYGVELKLAPQFSMKFILMGSASSEISKAAFISGIKFRDNLRARFPGIETKVTVRPTLPYFKGKNKHFWEVNLPKRGDFYHGDTNIIQKLINFAWLNRTNRNVTAYIFWQRDSNHKNYPSPKTTSLEPNWFEKHEQHRLKYYLLRILINVELEDTINLSVADLELKGQLESLASGIQNSSGNGATLSPAKEDTWFQILTDNFFEEEHSAFIEPKEFDFIFHEDIPLEKGFNLKNERTYFLNPNHPHNILLGTYMKNGALTKKQAYLHLNDFTKHVFISGLSGFGKTSFLAQLNERIRNTKKVGVLSINLLKKNDIELFQPDILLDESTPGFRVPWISFSDFVKNIEVVDQVATYTVASLGLKNIVVTIMNNAITKEMLDGDSLSPEKAPKSLKVAFKKALEWAKERPYHDKFQTNLLRAIENRAIKIFSDPRLEKIMATGPIPEWFTQWRNGKNVVIDLSSFTTSVKRLLIHAIFQLVKTHLPDLTLKEQYSNEVNDLKLRNIIMMDEIGPFFAKPRDQSVNDDETVTKHYLEVSFEDYLSSFRSRGIGLIFADQRPSRLFEGVYKLPSIKILFKTDIACLQ